MIFVIFVNNVNNVIHMIRVIDVINLERCNGVYDASVVTPIKGVSLSTLKDFRLRHLDVCSVNANFKVTLKDKLATLRLCRMTSGQRLRRLKDRQASNAAITCWTSWQRYSV